MAKQAVIWTHTHTYVCGRKEWRRVPQIHIL